jgi:hypothetical protein
MSFASPVIGNPVIRISGVMKKGGVLPRLFPVS